MFPVQSIYKFLKSNPSQEDCIKYLEMAIWNNKPVSPFDKDSQVYKYKNGKYRCRNTQKYFTVLTGTVFHATKLPLVDWFYAIWKIASNKNGYPAAQLARDIDVREKTAWFILQRIRACCSFENDNELFGTVELDECVVGGLNGNRHVKHRKTQEESWGKTWVFGMIQRGGKINAWTVPNRQSEHLSPYIHNFIKKGSRIISDMHSAYRSLSDDFAHTAINHDAYEYVSLENKSHHNNTIESAWRRLKDSVHRTYNHVSDKHLQKYLDEFVFRYNTRDLIESDKFNWLLANCKVRTSYKMLVGRV